MAGVRCALCGLDQAVDGGGGACLRCGVAFGRHACLLCRFFDDEGVAKGVWHCDACGICRVGGAAAYFHCHTCGCCYAVSGRATHVCVERATAGDCPVCRDALFDSVSPVSVLPCGHTLHFACAEQLVAHAQYCCPLCSRSMCDMRAAWAQRDAEVAATPMPEPYRSAIVRVLCADCGAKTHVAYHVLGLKCGNGVCGGYNTRRVGDG